METFDLIYYCDGYPEIGMGHVFRGIDIVNAYIKKHPLTKIAIQGRYHHQSMNFVREQLNSKITILNSNDKVQSDCSIVDTMFYPGEQRINQQFFSEIRKKCSTLIFLWDVLEYNVPNEVDIVINHLPNSKIYGDTKFKKYLGLKYTPVPIEFYENDSYKMKTGSILSIIGSSNMPNLIEPFLLYLEKLDTELEKIVIISPSYNKEVLSEFQQKFNNFIFKQNVSKIENYIKGASVVVTTYGNATFQAMASKVPTFTVAFQDFQNLYGEKLESTGYCVNLGMFEDLQIEKLSLITNDNFKIEMHKKLKDKFVSPGIDEIIRIISENLAKDKTNTYK
jgi:spore coat polysaccharide biosynthesis predicted glycosyltransferase SpsG